MRVIKRDGSERTYDPSKLLVAAEAACTGLHGVDASKIISDCGDAIYDGISTEELDYALVNAAKSRVAQHYNYSKVAARLLHLIISKKVGLGRNSTQSDYGEVFKNGVKKLVSAGRLCGETVSRYNLDNLAKQIVPERDDLFWFQGLKTLEDGYLLKLDGEVVELPQAFLMRVAMGLAKNESDTNREMVCIRFYEMMSTLRYMPSTPTLFNSCTPRSQCSSCFLSTVHDSIDGIYGAMHQQARLSKFAGGLGVDANSIRAANSGIEGTGGKSTGVIPFLKLFDATLVAVNQCFAPETRVYTQDGPKPISEITQGELVLTSSGEYREVTETMHYENVEPMVELLVKHSSGPICVTTGHPVFAVRGVPNEQSISRTLRAIEKGRHHADWTPAGDLVAGDYVAQVIPIEVVPVSGFGNDEAFLYGLMLGDGSFEITGDESNLTCNSETQPEIINRVKNYLTSKGIHFWTSDRGVCHQIRWSVSDKIPFTADDLYDSNRNKRIHPRLAHLPIGQALHLIHGLIESDGNLSRGKELTFNNTSLALVEGLRYQMLRLGVPTVAVRRERVHDHTGTRSDGSTLTMNCTTVSWDVRIPAERRIAALTGAKPLTKTNWFTLNGLVFSRLKKVSKTQTSPVVYDLKVDGPENYMTTAFLAHNGGRRKGSGAIYLQTWHLDIEDFIALRKNVGDERMRCHNTNTAIWHPDIFFKRVQSHGDWTLFCPAECPELNELDNQAFEDAYLERERQFEAGLVRGRRLKAVDLWKAILKSKKETGHPWTTFKDPSNYRYSDRHAGIVRSSNLCSEILRHSIATEFDNEFQVSNPETTETAVCNLTSINLVAHLKDGPTGPVFDWDMLGDTVVMAMRSLDNVIDANFYPTTAAKNSNMRYRPVGLGQMGWADVLSTIGIPFDSDAAVELADRLNEFISYAAILSSIHLAQERGEYQRFDGSLWSKGILPIDTFEGLFEERRAPEDRPPVKQTLNWGLVRRRLAEHGIRNGSVLAIAPTATIANICGVSEGIDAHPGVVFTKSNMRGEFTYVVTNFVKDCERLGIWSNALAAKLVAANGDVDLVELPDEIRQVYKTAFRVDPIKNVLINAVRQAWIDQGISFNAYLDTNSLKAISEYYLETYRRGLKTTYYLHSKAASSIEHSVKMEQTEQAPPVPVCRIDNPDCESCQ